MNRSRQSGLTVIEVLVSVAIGAVLILSLTGTVGQALEMQNETRSRGALLQETRFAFDRMLGAVRDSRHLLLPLADNPATTWREHVREQTVPPSAPEPGSVLATAVLAVTASPDQDLDGNGIADGDDDGDGRLDEDLGEDSTNDGASGIYLIDDDGDGVADDENGQDDDEDGTRNEDPIDSSDDDGDGAIDEDPNRDMNDDGQPGIAGVDDDGDGNVDEGANEDDDEDGVANEEWLNARLFYLNGGTLMERTPVPWDVTGDGLDGRDFVESPLADNVTLFRVERIPAPPGGTVTVDITLEVTDPDGNRLQLHSVVRVGGNS